VETSILWNLNKNLIVPYIKKVRKKEIKLLLCLVKHHAVKDYGAVGV
jgi:hypothetical protein